MMNHQLHHDLSACVALVTGAGSGIGRATCAYLARQGCTVVAADIDDSACNRVAEELSAEKRRVKSIHMDVSKASSVDAGVQAILEQKGRIDILVNCAGLICRTNVVDLTEDEWDRVINVNLKSVYLTSHAVVPAMKANGGGSIVNVASGWGLTGGANAVAYCAAKGGVVQITKAMAVDHGKDNIRVNCVCPGDTNTPMLVSEAKQLGLPPDALIQNGCHRPLGRVGAPEEIAAVIAFLSSTAASFMTGATVVVDGGGLAGSM